MTLRQNQFAKEQKGKLTRPTQAAPYKVAATNAFAIVFVDFQLLLTGNTRQLLIAAVSSSKGVVTTNADCFINTTKSMNHRATSVLLRCASLEFLFENEEYFCGEVTRRERGIKVTKTNKHHSNISFGA
ncbi:hypothetical protein Tco_1309057 [Tanacetum coccineum]